MHSVKLAIYLAYHLSEGLQIFTRPTKSSSTQQQGCVFNIKHDTYISNPTPTPSCYQRLKQNIYNQKEEMFKSCQTENY